MVLGDMMERPHNRAVEQAPHVRYPVGVGRAEHHRVSFLFLVRAPLAQVAKRRISQQEAEASRWQGH